MQKQAGVALSRAFRWVLLPTLAFVFATAIPNDGPTVNLQHTAVTSPSGFLDAGTHPIQVFQDASGAYGQTIYGGGSGSNIRVQSHANGTQTQLYTIGNLNFSWNIAGSTDTVNVNELDIEGLLFRTPGKQWRPLTTAGLALPNQTWSWSAQAVTSNTSLSFTGRTFLPAVEQLGDGGTALVQQVRMTFVLSGDVRGTITIDQFEEIGTGDRRRDDISGSLATNDGTARVDMITVLNGLDLFPNG